MSKVKFGLSNVHIAKRTEASSGVTYATPVAYEGAVHLTLEKNSEVTPFYADNKKYYISNSSSGYEGEYESAEIPTFFKTDYLGYVKDELTGILAETDMDGSEFALLFQVETDTTAKKYIIYNCLATNPSKEFETIGETKEPQTSALTLSISGEEATIGGQKRMVFIGELDSTDPAYATFFTTAPTIPTFAEVSA